MTEQFWSQYYHAKHMAKTISLSRSARCAYYDLYNACFIEGGFIPDDDEELSRRTGASLGEWLMIRPSLERMFVVDARGWHHPDLLKEMQRYDALIEKWKECLPRPYDKEFIDNRDIVRASNDACVYCGSVSGPFEVDHIVPVSRGGTNELSNLTLACKPCNRSKGAMLVEEWRN